jgi:hypothetical protein
LKAKPGTVLQLHLLVALQEATLKTTSLDFAGIPQTVRKVLTSPAVFFRAMPKTGGFLKPVVFLLLMGVVSGLIRGLFELLSSSLGLHLYAGITMERTSIYLLPVMYVAGFAVSGFVLAIILFVIWKLMGSGESYETSYRCVAYLSALSPLITLLGIIPYLGGAIGLSIISFYLVTASVQVHGIPARRAWCGFGILAAIGIVLAMSNQITERRVTRNMEQANESWQKTLEEMHKADQDMQKKMEEELKKHQQTLPPAE